MHDSLQKTSPNKPTVMANHSPYGSSNESLHLMRFSSRCSVLGPGIRAVVWVQGCPFRCPGCVVPESLPFEGGTVVPTDELADRLLSLPDIEGVTFSGGEPFAQASALARLATIVRERGLSVMSYTGYTIENLVTHGSSEQHELLRRLDILVDGPYVASRHTDKRWRGSDNQRVLFLTPRHREWADRIDDRGRWIEFEVEADGVAWMGIPPPGFRSAFEGAMVQHLQQLTMRRTS
jgi:anaerobic ribonucleoside-triphosphate reductase activating protein